MPWAGIGLGGIVLDALDGGDVVRALTALIGGDEPPWSRPYDPRRLHPTVDTLPMVKAAVDVTRRFVGDRIRPATHADSTDDLGPGDGAVVRVAGQRCAAYRDDSGRLHTVSATCTHLGCVVAFNDAEKTWDCPCHGSRFDTDGAVLHGPATEPLRPTPNADEPVPPGDRWR